MIDFNASQLTWIVIGACSIGGTGYMSMDGQIKEVDKKLAVVSKSYEDQTKIIERIQQQLDRIEQKMPVKNK